MPVTHTFATLCGRLNRAPVYVRGLQRRFGLPIPADSPSPPRSPRLRGETSHGPTVPPSDRPTVQPTTSYIGPYFSFLETVIHLRVLGIPEETLLHLWTLERKLMQLLHADSTGSPTWFLDSCISTTSPLRAPHSALRTSSHRLLLSNFDIGVYLPNQEPRTKNQEPAATLQLGLNFASKKPNPELFTPPEMGEDAILVLRQYQSLHQEILTAIHAETPILRAALNHFPPPRHSPARHKTRPEPKTHIGTLIPGEI
jgi:hypothetical protein